MVPCSVSIKGLNDGPAKREADATAMQSRMGNVRLIRSPNRNIDNKLYWRLIR
jgi:hypothetical protein